MSDHNASERILAAPFFFHFSVPCKYRKQVWSRSGISLDDEYRLPSFAELDADAGKAVAPWAELHMAWSEAGLSFNVKVDGKRQAPWCRATRVEDSDGLAVWIDTRNTPGIHRANRFCHHFRFLPAGGGAKLTDVVAAQLPVERARADAEQVSPNVLKARSAKRADGYTLEAHIPARALTGFDPEEHTHLGFTYVIFDRELGEASFTVGSEFPLQSDPSLWGRLELVRA